MVVELNLLVQYQGEMIDNIVQNINNAKHYIEKGNKNLVEENLFIKCLKYIKCFKLIKCLKNLKCIILIIVIAILLIILVPIILKFIK